MTEPLSQERQHLLDFPPGDDIFVADMFMDRAPEALAIIDAARESVLHPCHTTHHEGCVCQKLRAALKRAGEIT